MSDPFRETGVHYTSLSQEHQVGPARRIDVSELRNHLELYHNISIQSARTKAELGRLHMLVHAVLAYPELEQLMNLPPEWGH